MTAADAIQEAAHRIDALIEYELGEWAARGRDEQWLAERRAHLAAKRQQTLADLFLKLNAEPDTVS